ncbi:hypothetical protein [Nitrosospira sp. Nsp1]|uniref:hypothetical protein n=1 Tax=Nitrosospira sp. Nsp1 TaxID=136547 RepID=UPI000B865B62|nr:hypothetical protein [Nitrosospira sp. Nsp1]
MSHPAGLRKRSMLAGEISISFEVDSSSVSKRTSSCGNHGGMAYQGLRHIHRLQAIAQTL